MSPYVDDHGQVAECPGCKRRDQLLDDKDIIIQELERSVRGWALRNGKLRQEREGTGWKSHPKFADAEIAFNEWKRKCDHPKSAFTLDRFNLVLPYLENSKYGLKVVMMAISGAAFDPYTTRRKNGTIKKHDGWEQIFKNAGTVEEFANRVPPEDLPRLRAVA